MFKPALIAIEGIDGAGTTTLAARIAEQLRAAGASVHETRQPSTGPVGRWLREILKHGHKSGLTHPTTLSLLFAADRVDHLEREVLPALSAGHIIISDRWYHSSLAYQGSAEERAWIRHINSRAQVPDLALLIEVSAETAAKRRQERNSDDELFQSLEIQRRVASNYREVFKDLAGQEPVVTLDGNHSADQVLAAAWEPVLKVCRVPGVG